MFVCVHSTVLGPAGGGTRMRVYPAPADGLADAMRLSGAMTWKMAAAGMPRGGGKAVLAVPELPTGEPRRRLLRRYGELVASLGGTYRTAGDMNISPADLDVVAETCPWVYGTTGRRRATAAAARPAARCTRSAPRVEHVFGSPELAGRTRPRPGCRRRRRGARARAGGRPAHACSSATSTSRGPPQPAARRLPPERVLETEVDLYSPCAVGGTLNAESIPRLACRAVAGCANNQLAEPEDAERLHERGILYAPDYVVNAGGIIQLIGLEDEGWDEAQLAARARADRRHAADALRRGRRRQASRPPRPPTASCAGGSPLLRDVRPGDQPLCGVVEAARRRTTRPLRLLKAESQGRHVPGSYSPLEPGR